MTAERVAEAKATSAGLATLVVDTEADGEADSDGGEANEGAAPPPAQPVLALPARASSPEDMRRSRPA